MNMRYLSDYIEDKQTDLFEKTGAFFAFSKKQLDEQKKEGINYSLLGMGMICPKDNINMLLEGLDLIQSEGIKQDIKENGISAIIQRELGNHEAQITMDIEPTLDALEGYNITKEQVLKEYKIFFDLCVKNDWF